MKTRVLRCMITRGDGVFVAVCLDLSLGAQAGSIEEAKEKLEAQIDELFLDAKEHPEHARELLHRPAPLSMWLEYWFASAMNGTGNFFRRRGNKVKIFSLREDCIA